jgi:hypothetical protein
MMSLGPGARAAISVLLGATSGVLTSLMTNRWNWTLGIAFTVIMVAAAALAWLDKTMTSVPARTTVIQRAHDGSRIQGGHIRARRSATVKEIADHGSAIESSSITATEADVARLADGSTIANRDIVAD